MKRFGRRLAVGAVVLVNIFAFALPAGAAKPAAGGGGGSTVGVKIAAWDKTSGTWNKGNISGYAEQQVIPYHLQIDGGSSPTTVTSVQLQFDNFRTAPGIADFVNPAYLRSYSTNPGQVFYYCTGVGTAPVSDGDATPGFPGAASANCQTVPVFPTDPGSPPSGAYAVGPTFATVSGVRVGTYTWHNVFVPSNTTITLLWGAWLALGSHAYQGYALHVAIGNASVNGGTVSFGAKDVPIPVNQIIATSTDKKINGSDNPASVPVGTIVHVSITTQTFGPRSGTQDITIEDDLPPCMSYQDNASPAPSSVTTDASGTVITWSFPGTSNGSTLTVTFDAKAETPGNCTNLAITHSSIAPDTQDTVTLPITGLADLTISKTCPPT